MASYAKLKSGEWGVRVERADGEAIAGRSVVVRTKAGIVKNEVVDRVLWSDKRDGVSICSIVRRTEATTSPSRRSNVDAGDRPVRGCGACRNLGRMCRQCAFDEYDN